MLPHKPYKLALVIGSGGIRSVVGIGVFQALQESGLEPDLIVGCSAGALFGAALAEGHGAQAALKKAEQLWTAEVTQLTRWSALPALLLARFGFFKEDFSLKDYRVIADRIVKAFGDTQIQDMPVAMRVAATHAASGRRVVLDQGSLVDALCASSAIPFVFPPHKVDGHYLMDGVVSDPLPVLAAHDAHMVVTVGLDTLMPRQINSPFKMFSRIFAATTNNLMHSRLELARASGMLVVNIKPKFARHVRLFETTAMRHLVQEARRATLDVVEEIRHQMEAAPAQGMPQPVDPLAFVHKHSTAIPVIQSQ